MAVDSTSSRSEVLSRFLGAVEEAAAVVAVGGKKQGRRNRRKATILAIIIFFGFSGEKDGILGGIYTKGV